MSTYLWKILCPLSAKAGRELLFLRRNKLTELPKAGTIKRSGGRRGEESVKVIEFTVHTTTEGSELVADVLWQHTTGGVAILDAADAIALQKDKRVFWDYIDESAVKDTGEALVKCYFSVETAAEDMRAVREELYEMRERGRGYLSFGTLETSQREAESDEWAEIWKKHFRPLHIGSRIVVRPVWVDYTPAAGEEVVLLDSNMAFGTGEHETTSMCLELLQTVLKEGDTVIDVGCGSGILGISAVKLGARFAVMTDIDGIAVESAQHNAQLNGVAEQTQVVLTDLLGQTDTKGEIVLANITADILCRLAPSIPQYLKEDGTLILSGIIEPKLEQVKAAYGAQGLTCETQLHRGEWFALLFSRKK